MATDIVTGQKGSRATDRPQAHHLGFAPARSAQDDF
jgi:hypothetical protein